MWSPRRVLLMVVGLIVFLAGFRVYGHFLGGIDGLTPLPEDYWPDQTSEGSLFPPPSPRSSGCAWRGRPTR